MKRFTSLPLIKVPKINIPKMKAPNFKLIKKTPDAPNLKGTPDAPNLKKTPDAPDAPTNTKRKPDADDAPDTKKKPDASDVPNKPPNKSKNFCMNNVSMCAQVGLGAGVAGFYGLKGWKNMKEEKKQCLSVCYPDDWQAYKENKISTPTYKTKNAVSPLNPDVKYSILYPDMKDNVCTLENLTKRGFNPGECDKFCDTTCDYDVTDVVGAAADAAKNDVFGVIEGGLKRVLGENYKWWLAGILVIILFLILLPILLK